MKLKRKTEAMTATQLREAMCAVPAKTLGAALNTMPLQKLADALGSVGLRIQFRAWPEEMSTRIHEVTR